jgi:hypothetical protein
MHKDEEAALREEAKAVMLRYMEKDYDWVNSTLKLVQKQGDFATIPYLYRALGWPISTILLYLFANPFFRSQ